MWSLIGSSSENTLISWFWVTSTTRRTGSSASSNTMARFWPRSAHTSAGIEELFTRSGFDDRLCGAPLALRWLDANEPNTTYILLLDMCRYAAKDIVGQTFQSAEQLSSWSSRLERRPQPRLAAPP